LKKIVEIYNFLTFTAVLEQCRPATNKSCVNSSYQRYLRAKNIEITARVKAAITLIKEVIACVKKVNTRAKCKNIRIKLVIANTLLVKE
jgi:hypothetical protein